MAKRMCVLAAAIMMYLVIATFAYAGDSMAGSQVPQMGMSLTDVPQMLNYQGVLKDGLGNPLDTTVTMTFSIYNVSTGGTALWTETHGFVTAIGGVFSVLLGSGTSIPTEMFESTERWLGLAVGADPEMEPRMRIVSSAYAYHALYADYADDADLLDGQDASEFAAATHNHDSRYYTEAELNTSDGNGPNTGSNRVHWDNLVGVPAGFADGTDNTGSGGAGDGHSLDAADGDPIDAVYVNNDGNVGVGTTNPAQKLDVDGKIVIRGNSYSTISNYEESGREILELRGKSTHTDGAGINLYGDGDATYPGLFTVFTGGLNRLTIPNNGNVGIGTTAPAQRLDVAGTAQMTGFKLPTGASNGYVLTSDASGVGTWQAASGGTGEDWGRYDVSDTLYEGMAALSAKYLGISAKAADADALDGHDTSYFAAATHAHHSLDAADGSPTEALYVNNDGKVGIGTTNPAERLDINGKMVIRGNSYSTISNYAESGREMLILQGKSTQANGAQICLCGDGDALYPGLFTVFTGNLNRLTIPNNGNVGIGTTAPAQRLDVAGTAQMTGFKLPTGASNGYILTSDASGVGTWQASAGIGGSGTTDYIPKFTASSTLGNSVIYESSGKVGINTTSPDAKLHVVNTTHNLGFYLRGVIAPSGNYSNQVFYMSNDQTTVPSNGMQCYMVLNAQGAGNPNEDVDAFIDFRHRDARKFSMGIDGSDGDRFKIGTSGIATNTRLTIDGTGNIGIGTTNPARTLHVSDVMRLQPRATAPSSPSEGDMYMDSSTHKLMVYDGSSWQACW